MPSNYRRIYEIPNPGFDGDCAQTDPELFFTQDAEGRGNREETAAERRDREHAARKVCASCPFLVECALHGLEHEEFGIWGAFTEKDRRAFDGRGFTKTASRGLSQERVLRDLARAGIAEDQIRTILMLWRVRQQHIDIESEVA